MHKLTRIFKHRWLDASDSRRTVPDDATDRLARRIAASESRHTGEIRICVEASLPLGDLWRINAATPLKQVVRDRALAWYGRLGVWDTEQNNGILIYLLLAEHAIEFVADRALSRHIPASEWQAIVDRLGRKLHDGQFENGLTQALEEVSALLVTYFPTGDATINPNQLPNSVVRV